MSIQWKSPKSGQCCECKPGVCDPCDACPTAEMIEVTLSGVLACCASDNQKLTGLGAVNGAHTLTRQESGEYTVEVAGGVSFQSFEEEDCATLAGTDGPYGVTVRFACSDEIAVVDVYLTDSGLRLFYAEITPPAAGELFVFEGATDCGGLTPYTYGGSATFAP